MALSGVKGLNLFYFCESPRILVATAYTPQQKFKRGFKLKVQNYIHRGMLVILENSSILDLALLGVKGLI